MKIIVDTCVWSLALRRNAVTEQVVIKEFTELIKEFRVQIIGPIRQELLSGIKSEQQFKELQYYLSAFSDLHLESKDYEKAAEFYNICRGKGIQGSNIDFLICAAAYHRNFEIFTTDRDFDNFQKYLPVSLYKIRGVS